MKKIIVTRHWSDTNQSTGTFLVVDEKGQPIFGCLCIERGDRNNQRNVSRVNSGTYELVLEWSPKFKRNLWELKGTEGRSEAKIHPSNYWDQLNGCIALGLRLKDLDNDGYYDVTNSGNTVKEFHEIMKGQTISEITITDAEL
tara:strand:+ start:49 stop:477 length:429 start_codon:yes stop_codon:yes gene_type:complete